MPEKLRQRVEANQGRGEFFEGAQKEEVGMAQGVLSKIDKIPRGLRKGIMAFAAAGALFSATEVSAGERYRGPSPWAPVIERVVRSAQEEAMARQQMRRTQNQIIGESVGRAVDRQYESHDRYHETVWQIEEEIRRERYQIMVGHGAPEDKARALSQLERKRAEGLMQAERDYRVNSRGR